jgi:WD40 repeat protein
VVVRDLASGSDVTLGGGPDGAYDVWDAQFSPDGERVAAITERGPIFVWRLDDPTRPDVLRGHVGHENGLEFAADGRLATAGGDGTVRVWPVEPGPEVVMRGHTTEASGVAFWPDGSKVVSTSRDGTLRLWNSRTGDAMGRLASGNGGLDDVAVSDDGNIATLGEDDVLRIFKCNVCGSVADVEALARSRHPRELNAEERERFLVSADD